MGNHNQNGRGVTGPGEGRPSARPREQDAGDDDVGQGQSGFAAGRQADERAMQTFRNRNQSAPHGEEHEQGFGVDDRFSGGRGGEDYWIDRSNRSFSSGVYRGQGDRGMAGHGPRERTGWSSPPPGPQRGLHAGKGPKGYQRSDDRIREHVCEVLTDDHDIDASNIEVTVHDGEVTLSGAIADRMMKRMAEDTVWQISGVKDVQNNLKIGESPSPGNPSGRSAVGTNETETSPTERSKHRA